MTTSSGKHLEDIYHAHIVSLRKKLITSAKDSDDMSIGFGSSRDRRQKELTKIENMKFKFNVRFIHKDVFGFAGHQRKTAHGLGYK